MFIDRNLQFFDDEVITTGAPTEYKSDSLLLSVVDEMLREGKGEPLEVLWQVTKAFAGGTSVVLHTITAPEASLATDESHYITPAIVNADLFLGAKFRFPLAMVSPDTATHFGVMLVATGTFTGSSAISCWVQRVGEDQNSY